MRVFLADDIICSLFQFNVYGSKDSNDIRVIAHTQPYDARKSHYQLSMLSFSDNEFSEGTKLEWKSDFPNSDKLKLKFDGCNFSNYGFASMVSLCLCVFFCFLFFLFAHTLNF